MYKGEIQRHHQVTVVHSALESREQSHGGGVQVVPTFAPLLSQLGSSSRQAELCFEGLQIMQKLQTSLILPFPAGGGSSPEHCAPLRARSSRLSNSSSRFTSHSNRHRRRRGGKNSAKLTKIKFKTLLELRKISLTLKTFRQERSRALK